MIANGFHWPEKDVHCRQVVFDTTRDMEHALRHCAEMDICVQAGGNCGVWPAWLAEHFETVYTFEPDPENFRCLVQNVPENVITLQAALGMRRETIDLHRDPVNCGAYYVNGAGNIPTLRIDDLELPSCDLIVLDIEGMEADALEGAILTVQTFHPVIMAEDKGLSERYGIAKGAIEARMGDLGYRVAHRIHRDVIMVHG
ncbi:MAG: FkbM family methyltransferase [Hyphomicrobiaceae bacterium]